MLSFLAFEFPVERLGWVLVHSLWQFAMLSAVALAVMRLMRRSAASARYAVLLAAMALAVALPIITWVVLPVERPPEDASMMADLASTGPTEQVLAVRDEPSRHSPWAAPLPLRDNKTADTVTSERSATEAEEPSTSNTSSWAYAVVARWWSLARRLLRPWLATIVVAWCFGVAAFSVRPLLSWYTVRRLRRSGGWKDAPDDANFKAPPVSGDDERGVASMIPNGDRIVVVQRPLNESGQGSKVQSIYDDELKRFAFQLEKADAVKVSNALMVNLGSHVYGVWADVQNNRVVVIAPAESERAIRQRLAEQEAIAAQTKQTRSLDVQQNELEDRKQSLLDAITELEVEKLDRADNEGSLRKVDERMATYGAELSQIEDKLKVIRQHKGDVVCATFDEFMKLVSSGKVAAAVTLTRADEHLRRNVGELAKLDGLDQLVVIRVYADADDAMAITGAAYWGERDSNNRGYLFLFARRDGDRWLIHDIDQRPASPEEKVLAEVGQFWVRNPDAKLLRSESRIEQPDEMPLLKFNDSDNKDAENGAGADDLEGDHNLRQGASADAKATGPARVLHFPADHSIGRLWVYESDTDLAQLDEHACVEARGDVDVPAGKRVGLQYVDPRIKNLAADQPWDLSPLDDLRSTDLDFLMFVFARLPTDELKRLTRHTSLRMLSIGISEMNEDGLASFGKIASLEGLTFGEIKISDKGLAQLKDLHNLRRLHLGSGGITNEGLPHLAKLNKLEELDLTWASINDAGLPHLAHLTNMQQLRLGRTKISGAGLVHLVEMKSLERLDLADTDLSDAGLKHLESLRRLRWLDLSRTKVTPAGVTVLQRQIPDTKIVSDVTGK